MKLKLKRKKLKNLSTNSKKLNKEQTPMVAGGSGIIECSVSQTSMDLECYN